MNYYRRYMADYLSKTAALTLAEHGAYTLLLDYSYLQGGRLPADMESICRMLRAVSPSERAAVSSVLGKFFTLEGDEYVNGRVAEEVEKARPAIEAAKANGLKGGRPKANPLGSVQKPSGLSAQNPDGTQDEPKAKASQPLTSNQNLKTSRASRSDLAERFDQFWAAYPKKKSRGDAEKAWATLRPDEQLHDRLLQAIERAKTSADWRRENGQFIPYPATWLRAKGWEDAIDAPIAPALSLAV